MANTEDHILRGAGQTILIVDDDPMILRILSEMMSMFNYSYIDAMISKEAYEKFKRNKDLIRLVITDIRLPDYSGIDLAYKIRNASPNLPIIFITGYPEGMDEYLTKKFVNSQLICKPFTLNHLMSTVHYFFQSEVSMPQAY